jgi:hypothetical protein
MHFGWLIGWLLAITAVVLLSIGFTTMEFGTEHIVTMTVSQLDDQGGGNSHKYLVYAANVGTNHESTVFEDTDAWFHGKTNSSDLWFALQHYVGKTIRCDVYGYRIHLLSSYQDILWCHDPAGEDIIQATGGG